MSSLQRLDIAAVSRLTELADYIIPMTLGVVAELGVADHMTSGPCNVETLAELTGAHKPSLLIAMRGLASKGVFHEPEPEVFALTSLGEYLRTDHGYSLRDSFAFQRPDIVAWSEIEHTMRTGEPAFPYAHGRRFWEYMGANSRDSQRFDASQDAMTRLELPFINRCYPWHTARTVVDVGGGNGAFISGLLAKRPGLKGTLFDLPHVVAGAQARLASAGVVDRCTVAGGSFLNSPVPAGADLYMMKRVLWGHRDEEAVKLLANVRAAMRPDSVLLIIEPIRSEGPDSDIAKVVDLKLLALGGAGSRNVGQFESLFAATSLKLDRVISAHLASIVCARPVCS